VAAQVVASRVVLSSTELVSYERKDLILYGVANSKKDFWPNILDTGKLFPQMKPRFPTMDIGLQQFEQFGFILRGNKIFFHHCHVQINSGISVTVNNRHSLSGVTRLKIEDDHLHSLVLRFRIHWIMSFPWKWSAYSPKKLSFLINAREKMFIQTTAFLVPASKKERKGTH
jgi:hypothetical protein